MREPARRERRDLPQVRTRARRAVRRAVILKQDTLIADQRISYAVIATAAIAHLITGLLVIPFLLVLLGALHLMASEFLQRLFGERPAPDAGTVDGGQATATPVPPRAIEQAPPPPALPPPGPESGGFDFSDERIPGSVRPKVADLVGLINSVESRARADSIPSPAVIDIRRIRDTHLPTLLQSYFIIPPEHRNEIYRKTGKSASYGLGVAIDALRQKVEKISLNMAQGQIDQFEDNLRFIQETYGTETADPLDLQGL